MMEKEPNVPWASNPDEVEQNKLINVLNNLLCIELGVNLYRVNNIVIHK